MGPEKGIPSKRISGPLNTIYNYPKTFPLLTDMAAWYLGLGLGSFLKLTTHFRAVGSEILIVGTLACMIQLGVGFSNGLYRKRWRVASFRETIALTAAWLATSFAVGVINYVSPRPISMSDTALAIGTVCTALIMGATRGIWRTAWEASHRPSPEGARRTIIFGAGEGGAQMVQSMLRDPDSKYYPVALLDDDPAKSNRVIDGISVEGTRQDLARVASQTKAHTLLVAIANADGRLIAELATEARSVGLDLRILPTASELVGRMTVADVRQPTADDVLGRDSVDIDLESVASYVRGRRVLVTGAGGSIGSELSVQLHGFGPSELYLLDRDETNLHGVQLSIEGRALLDSDSLIVANIRDRERVFEIFDQIRPDVVFHAAALKHLTLLQNHPMEGVKTNTIGTANLLDAAEKFDVKCFVNVSTDKAADPTSVLGATKLAAERLTANAARRTGRRFVSVRFGNVLNSRGSVMPTFLEQIRLGKPITVTHPDATRYFMTIPEAVRLVVQAGAIGEPGEVMILDMGEPVKILDLANQLIAMLDPSIEIEFTGLRPGEKLHEILVANEEVGTVRAHPRIMHTTLVAFDPLDALATGLGGDHLSRARDLLIVSRDASNNDTTEQKALANG